MSKKFIFLFLLFIPLISFSQTLDITLSTGDPLSSMYLLNNRYFSPAEVEGIMGAVCNPAGIESDKNFEIGVIWSFPMRLSSQIGLPVDLNGTEIRLPVTFSVDQIGGLDLGGFSLSKGPFTVAIGVMRGTLMGINIAGSIDESIELPTITLYDTLTHEDFAEIPDTTEIPIIEEVSGSLHISANGNFGILGGSAAKSFLLFSLGNKYVSIGGGIKHTTRYISLPGVSVVGVGMNPLRGTVIADTLIDSTWQVSVNIETSLQADSFLVFQALGGGQQAVVSYLGGLQLMGGPMRAGIAIEYTPSCDLGDSLYFTLTHPTGINPQSMIDTINSDVDIDTINHTITGYLYPASPQLEDTTIVFFNGYPMTVASTFTLRGGMVLHMLAFYIGGSGAIDFLGDGNIGSGSMYGTFDVGLDFNIFAIRLNLMYRQPYYKIVIPQLQEIIEEQFGDVFGKSGLDTYMGIPEFSGGISFGINAGYMTIDFGARLNSLSAISGIIGSVDSGFDISKMITYGIGVRVRL